ncbi:MAG: hypothetical protein V1644_01255 [Candidatus Micrarchaeota archaeon]
MQKKKENNKKDERKMQLIPEQYHPRNAERTERIGAFNIHDFADGTQLTTLRRYEARLFEEHKIKKVIRNYKPVTHVAGQIELITRKTRIPAKFLEICQRLKAAKVKFETPVAWLEAENPTNDALVTIYRKKYETLTTEVTTDKALVQRTLESAFHELGKMHGAGIVHGHPHYYNILTNGNGNVHFIDPKYMRKHSTIPPTAIPRYDEEYWREFGTAPTTNAQGDLQMLLGYMNQGDHLQRIDVKKLNDAYLKGVELGRKRTAEMK